MYNVRCLRVFDESFNAALMGVVSLNESVNL